MSRITPEDCEDIFSINLQKDIKKYATPEEIEHAQTVWVESNGTPTSVASTAIETMHQGGNIGAVTTLLEYATLKDSTTNMPGIDYVDAGQLIIDTLLEQSDRLEVPTHTGHWLKDLAQDGQNEALATRLTRRAREWAIEVQNLRRCRQMQITLSS